MQILEYPYIWEWCRDHGVTLDETAGRPTRLASDPALSYRSRVVFAPTGASGHEPAVGSGILAALSGWTECLVWITTWGVWPSSEDWPRYYAFRARHGQRLSIDDAPGHLVTPDEVAEFRELLLLVLQYGWDAWVIPAIGERAGSMRIEISHDGWAMLYAREPTALVVQGLASEAPRGD